MTLVNLLLHATNFHSPLLRCLAPCFATAFVIQGAVAVPSILARSERFFDIAGSATFLAVGALSVYLPALLPARGAAYKYAVGAKKFPRLPSLVQALRGGGRAHAGAAGLLLGWRQLAATGMTAAWAVRRELLSLSLSAI